MTHFQFLVQVALNKHLSNEGIIVSKNKLVPRRTKEAFFPLRVALSHFPGAHTCGSKEPDTNIMSLCFVKVFPAFYALDFLAVLSVSFFYCRVLMWDSA